MISFNASDFLRKSSEAAKRILNASEDGEDRAADELLRLSQLEVPLDKSTLANSGHADRDSKGAYVAYGGPASDYAVRLHEHPEYSFQHGRKGKYLEDPLKHNQHKFLELMGEQVKGAI
jgi:hypothetical protein